MGTLEQRERLKNLILHVRGTKSQRWYAELLGVSPTAVQDWESGRAFPNENSLRLIAQSRGWSFTEMREYLSTGKIPEVSEFDRVLSRLRVAHRSEVFAALKVITERCCELESGSLCRP